MATQEKWRSFGVQTKDAMCRLQGQLGNLHEKGHIHSKQKLNIYLG